MSKIKPSVERKPVRKSRRAVRVTRPADKAVVDPQAWASTLPEADQRALIEASQRYQQRAHPPVMTFKPREGETRAVIVSPAGDSAHERQATLVRMSDALGSRSQPFIDAVMSAMADLWEANGTPVERNYNAALAVLSSIKPESELEAMLALQMVAANDAAIRCTTMIGRSGEVAFGNLANKFMRTFTSQVEALAKLRRGGEQVVRHVHVNEGGQAIVAGTFNHLPGDKGAGGGKTEIEGQSDAT